MKKISFIFEIFCGLPIIVNKALILSDGNFKNDTHLVVMVLIFGNSIKIRFKSTIH
jgi:hypothetical protein